METSSVEQLSHPKLARLLNLKLERSWTKDDGVAALRHQLEAPLSPDLLLTETMDADELAAFLKKYSGPTQFRTQLLATAPSLILLSAIKQFAKQVGGELWNPLSGDPARVLYFASIAAALTRCRILISQMPAEEIKAGFMWAQRRPGAEALQPLFQYATSNIVATFDGTQ